MKRKNYEKYRKCILFPPHLLVFTMFSLTFSSFLSFSSFPPRHPGGEALDQGGRRPGGKEEKYEKDEKVKENICNTSK